MSWTRAAMVSIQQKGFTHGELIEEVHKALLDPSLERNITSVFYHHAQARVVLNFEKLFSIDRPPPGARNSEVFEQLKLRMCVAAPDRGNKPASKGAYENTKIISVLANAYKLVVGQENAFREVAENGRWREQQNRPTKTAPIHSLTAAEFAASTNGFPLIPWLNNAEMSVADKVLLEQNANDKVLFQRLSEIRPGGEPQWSDLELLNTAKNPDELLKHQMAAEYLHYLGDHLANMQV